MSEQKRYTAQKYRDLATQVDDECADAIANEMTIASEFDVDSAQHLRDMLRQAADAEEENAQLKARMEAVEYACKQAKKLVSQISMPMRRENGWCSTDPMIATGLNTIFSAIHGKQSENK